jgi:hypothetical protein
VALPKGDIEYLEGRYLPYTACEEAGMTCVVLGGFRLPSGYAQSTADLLIRLNPGFPDVPPDMWWFEPAVARADGQPIPATQHSERHLGRTWQRWSRHFTPGQWQAGTDSLETFLALIRRELERCAQELVS